MKKSLLVIIAALTCAFNAQGQLTGSLSGVLPGNTVYTVVGDIRVLEGDSLIIEAGAALLFNQGLAFDINGYIHAAGTVSDSVKFLNGNLLTWSGIDFNPTSSDSCKLEYCRVSGGNPAGDGGGLHFDGCGPAIAHCTISGNTAQHGGGIKCVNSANPTFIECSISENTAQHGGGIYCDISADPSFINCVISGNTASLGGGGGFNMSTGCDLVIANSIISDNTAANSGGGFCFGVTRTSITGCVISNNTTNSFDGGGGIYCSSATSNLTIDSCVIVDNSGGGNGGKGGGIFLQDDMICNITNCTISGNTTTSYGGGIYCMNSSPNITDCEITLNIGSSGGGGIQIEGNSNPTVTGCNISNNSAGGIHFFGGDALIRNCTVFGNNGDGFYCSSASPAIVNCAVVNNSGYGCHAVGSSQIIYSDFYHNTSGNFNGGPAGMGQLTTVNFNGDSCDVFMNVILDPLFVDPPGRDYHLQAGSPCIDAGDPFSPHDPDNTIADIGAYYFNQSLGPEIELSTYTLQFPETAVGDTCSLPLIIYNTGDVDLIIQEISSGLPNYFSTNWNPQDSIISAGDSLVLEVYFTPDVIEDYYDIMIIENSDSTVMVNLQGEGTYADVDNADKNSLPDRFILEVPYPNPFNPTITISFALPIESIVKIEIFNLLGQRMVTLKEGILQAGNYKVQWNGGNIDGGTAASGIYILKMEAEGIANGTEFRAVSKLILTK